MKLPVCWPKRVPVGVPVWRATDAGGTGWLAAAARAGGGVTCAGGFCAGAFCVSPRGGRSVTGPAGAGPPSSSSTVQSTSTLGRA